MTDSLEKIQYRGKTLLLTRVKHQNVNSALDPTAQFNSSGSKLKHAPTVVAPCIPTLEVPKEFARLIGKCGILKISDKTKFPIMIMHGKKLNAKECRLVMASERDASVFPDIEDVKAEAQLIELRFPILEASEINLVPLNEKESELNHKFVSVIQAKLRISKYIFINGMTLCFKVFGESFKFSVNLAISPVLSEDAVYRVTNFSKINILPRSTNINISKNQKIFDDTVLELGGLDDTLRLIKESIVSEGSSMPSGILLHGPPGTGKTMIVKRVCYELDANFFSIDSSEVASKYVGKGSQKLKELFAQSKLSSSSVSIIFLDEIDSFCPSRDEISDSMNQQLVFTLISEMDALCHQNSMKSNRIIVIGATNRIHSVDSSLRRPGRFEKEIEIGVPSPSARHQILLNILKRIPNNLSSEDFSYLAEVTHGYVGADIKNLVKEASMNCLSEKMKAKINSDSSFLLSQRDFKIALTRTKPSALREIMIEVPNIKWSDIGGQSETKMKVKEAVEWPLKYPHCFERMGIRPPRGILLYGPPGTGKTMLARAIATESAMNFIAVKGPELLSKWVGESEKSLREVFRKARLASPCVIFFDEIDSIGSSRGADFSEGNSASSRVLSQLLAEMDGISDKGSKGIVVVGATNVIDVLDPALLRPGRFDQCLFIGPPDTEGRKEIFKLEMLKLAHAPEILDEEHLEIMAHLLEGKTGAEIASMCRESAMIAIEEDAERIEWRHFISASASLVSSSPHIETLTTEIENLKI
jgi:SpoVK/Ycf46/Vps4 family AAA+-type ATPase